MKLSEQEFEILTKEDETDKTKILEWDVQN